MLTMAFVMLSLTTAMTVQAQTYKYRQVKIVNKNTGEEHAGGTVVKYVTFSNGKSAFSFTDMSGRVVSRGAFDTEIWSFMNYAPVQGGTGMSVGFVNPRVFKYQSTNSNGIMVYKNNRSVTHNTTGQVGGYITDYINFSSDYKRFNVISGGTDRENGVGAFYTSIPLCDSNQILVFELVENANSGDFY